MVNRCLLITRLCRLACPRILLISDSAPFCDFPRKHVPARLAIFVAQLGRKFHLFSLTMQRYEIFRSPPNFFAKKARKKARTWKSRINVIQFSVFSFTFARVYTYELLIRFLYYYNNIKIIYNIYYSSLDLVNTPPCIFLIENWNLNPHNFPHLYLANSIITIFLYNSDS